MSAPRRSPRRSDRASNPAASRRDTEIDRTLLWNASNAAANAAASYYIGVSRTLRNGLPLPLNLSFLGVGPTASSA